MGYLEKRVIACANAPTLLVVQSESLRAINALRIVQMLHSIVDEVTPYAGIHYNEKKHTIISALLKGRMKHN